jgi:hypothetical protein
LLFDVVLGAGALTLSIDLGGLLRTLSVPAIFARPWSNRGFSDQCDRDVAQKFDV